MQTNTSESLPRTIPELLENHTIQVQPQGYSMYPLLCPAGILPSLKKRTVTG